MRALIVLLILAFSIGCRHMSQENKLTHSESQFRDSLIIPDDLKTFSRDSSDTYWIPKDTITKSGNYVRYLKTRNEYCSDNLYINWGNDSINRIFIAQNVLQYRSYFTPELEAETMDYLILEHGCATDCSAVLFLPLNNSEKAHDITDIIKYSKTNYTVVKAIGNDATENEHEFIELFNVKTNKMRRIAFKYSGIAAQMISLVDSCNITDNEIYIRANLYDRAKDKEVVEFVRLKNDLKK